MLYKKLWPLKEDYKTIVLSVTEIEHALSQVKYTSVDEKKSANIFWTWHLVEQVAWATISKWKEYWLEQCEIIRKYMDANRMKYYSSSWKLDKQFERVYNWLEQIVELTWPYEAQYDLRNFRMMCELDCSSYKVILSWELDWGMDWVAIWDCKTAWTKWNAEERRETWCYQARFYPFIMMLAHPETNEIAFNYWVYTKQKTIQLQQIEHILTRDECEKFVREKMYQYLEKLARGDIDWKSTVLDRM